MARHRRCIVLRGSADATRDEALALTEGLDAVLFVDGSGAAPAHAVPASRVKRLLGRAYDAVVLDLHGGLDADVFGQAHGMVWGGGRLVLRMPPTGEAPIAGRARFAVHPHRPRDVTPRFWWRFERCLARSDAVVPASPVPRASRDVRGSAEQRAAVDRLVARLGAADPTLTALLADRGRGKSSALGLALREVLQDPAVEVAVTADRPGSTAEIFRFALDADAPIHEGRARYVPPLELLRGPDRPQVIVVDEAAQLPVPLLQRLVAAHPDARLAFATTVRGYEGTGRGFVLRFLEWLRSEPRPLALSTLEAPIRWDAGDPLERLVFDALVLDAEPTDVSARPATGAEPRAIPQDALAADEGLLRGFFGLLVHAHYRTTPSDLHRLLDAPNLRLHAMVDDGRVVAASFVALEGELPLAMSRALARGTERIRGHALADNLVCHCGRVDAGPLTMVRSVRIATHPERRRRGLATALVDHVHAAYAPDLFGTVFGATPELLRFRRAVGYALVRIGASRGERTGEPAAVMIRPVSPRARALVAELRADLARDLPLQLALLDADGELGVDPDLADGLREGLPAPRPLDDEARLVAVASYAFGARPYESAVWAVTRTVEAHAGCLSALEPSSRRLIETRILAGRPWPEAARAADFPSVRAAMRALRPAVRALAADAGLDLAARAP
ncbi:MAG TPA: GNAT family N-acetyltransferase [Sandaracinaceae bacterium LLY-WYZ-13_1]|nr:GNAT family N-acetyltransferase [Sandaracinaceae bacterium LLY-WYZ-13_1]